jgi:two-component system cell cycle sensor histidine kinase PleC
MERLMRSSEHSGAGAEGFGTGDDMAKAADEPSKAEAPPRIFFQVSSVTVAVAITAFLGATLFVAFDTVRTIEDARADLRLIGGAIAASLARQSPQVDGDPLARAMQGYGEIVTASFDATPDRAAPLISHRIEGGELGAVMLRIDEGAALATVYPRGAAAFFLAFLVTAVSFRRRPEPAAVIAPTEGIGTVGKLIAAIPFGVACWTREGELLACNERYRASIGSDERHRLTYHQAVKQLIRGGYMKLVSNDDASRSLELHREDGACLMIDERPLGEEGFVTLVSDVTERKRTDALLSSIREEQRQLARRYHEEKLKAEAASRAKTNFLAHLSHDVRTPLNHIIGFAELIRHQTFGPVGDPRYLEYVQNIKSSGEGLLDSFATILDLAELEGGQKALNCQPVAIDDILADLARRYRPQAVRAGIRFEVGAPCDVVLNADRYCLQRMLGNVLDNAVRFTPSGGRITLAAFAGSDGVVVEVTDTGLGMSEDRLASLAHPFALGDASFTREGGGPGLGIPIARAIAELSGGRMAIDSSPALGTTVAVSLPVRVETVVERAAA